MQDDEEPTASDPGTHFDWWNKRGTTEWVQYTFDKAHTVSQSEVFWYDDSARGGGCAVPASWQLLYLDGGEWKPVAASGAYGLEKGAYNQVAFKPVSTTAMRLEVRIQDKISTGVQKWHVK